MTQGHFYVGPPTSRDSWVAGGKNCVDPIGIHPQGGRLRRWAINPGMAWGDSPLGLTLLMCRDPGPKPLDPHHEGRAYLQSVLAA